MTASTTRAVTLDPTLTARAAQAGRGTGLSAHAASTTARGTAGPPVLREGTTAPRGHGRLRGPIRHSERTPATPAERRRRSAPARPSRANDRTDRRPGRPVRLGGSGTGWASGTFHRRVRLVRSVLVLAMLLLVARLIDVQVLHAGAYTAAARGESSITVSVAVAPWRHLRP